MLLNVLATRVLRNNYMDPASTPHACTPLLHSCRMIGKTKAHLINHELPHAGFRSCVCIGETNRIDRGIHACHLIQVPETTQGFLLEHRYEMLVGEYPESHVHQVILQDLMH